MSLLTADRFGEYFEELHGHRPYPWQQRLAARVVTGEWPAAIDLPTGSGKTACLDIAVFALACQAARPLTERTAPRRIFFCVNRRVIVDEAYDRARHIARRIWNGERNGAGVLAEVAEGLRGVAGIESRRDIPPLDVLELRGGIYRDSRWARSISQPTIICTTLDQLGSRLLFRGYGVSPSAAPIHAALAAYDSLILLDEAHISEPFRQTLDFVTRYLDSDRWSERPVGIRPAVVVPMTATPNEQMQRRGVIGLQDDDLDYACPLRARLEASKPAELRPPVADVAAEAFKTAVAMAQDQPVAVGIIVNRVATARAIHRKLLDNVAQRRPAIPPDVTIELAIGSMRPLDRDEQVDRLRPLVGPGRPERSERCSFVVATQCLEVGADYDFDVLITECASLDALRQRFGRLNRAGREIVARAVIVADRKAIRSDEKLSDEKPLDPIYGNALARTWNWLNHHAAGSDTKGRVARAVDFGIDSFDRLLRDHGAGTGLQKELLAPSASADAPLMMPAYIDLWCQTAPRPVPDPDVSLFIHGPRGGEPDVQVCWRADLVDDARMQPERDWCDVVALLPPSSAECMRVPISRFRRWLNGERDDETGDLLGGAPSDVDRETGGDRESPPRAVLWRGLRQSRLLDSTRNLRPGDTVVLPAGTAHSDWLGHLPELRHDQDAPDTVHDLGEAAFRRARDRAALRLHPALRDVLGAGFGDLLAAAMNSQNRLVRHEDWRALLAAAAGGLSEDHPWKRALGFMAEGGLHVEGYPDGRGVVLTARRRLESANDWYLPATDDGEDETSLIERRHPVLLADHTRHVVEAVTNSIEALPLAVDASLFRQAAQLHDLGKADERFQAMLRRSDRTEAWLLAGLTSTLWAKSDGVPQTPAQRREAARRAGLPDGFRHEMLSAQLAGVSGDWSHGDEDRDLLLHLIAAHHGYARPFAPVVVDEELPAVAVEDIEFSHERRCTLVPPHRIDSGVADRFWRLTRRYGWWGLPLLEAVLRLADQRASADEAAGANGDASVPEAQEAAG